MLNYRNVFIAFIISFLFSGTAVLVLSYSNSLTDTSIRKVTMIDTKATTFTHKRNITFNINGYFVDTETGNKFYHPINDKLYRDFEYNKNIPIVMDLELSIQDINGNKTGSLLTTVAVLLLFFNFMILISLSIFDLFNKNRVVS